MKTFDELIQIIDEMTSANAFGSASSSGYNPENPVSSDWFAPNDSRSVFGFDKGKPITRFGKIGKNKKGKKS